MDTATRKTLTTTLAALTTLTVFAAGGTVWSQERVAPAPPVSPLASPDATSRPQPPEPSTVSPQAPNSPNSGDQTVPRSTAPSSPATQARPAQPGPQREQAAAARFRNRFRRGASVAGPAVASARRRRLSRAPDMLGDSFLPPFQLFLQPQIPNNGIAGSLQLATAGGSARAKISEHNKALPVDRIYANYNHFHNAVQRNVRQPMTGESFAQRQHADRFTLGIEQTVFDGDTSIEFRLPLTAYPDFAGNIPSQGALGNFRSDTGTVGNLSVVGKRLLVDADDLVVSAGLGIEAPTGADAAAFSGATLFEMSNQSVYLQPFLAATLDNERTFIHSFLQIDIDTNGSSLTVTDIIPPAPAAAVGRVRQPTLIHWDTSVGYWLAKSEDSMGITGIAALCEFHLTADAGDGGQLTGVVPNIGPPVDFTLQSSSLFPATYVTTGLHIEVCQDTTIRVAGAFPLTAAGRRLFDSEVLVQVGRRY